jgi:hypothetical protein
MREKKNVLPLMVNFSCLLCDFDLRLGGRNVSSFLQCSRGKYMDVFLKEIIKKAFPYPVEPIIFVILLFDAKLCSWKSLLSPVANGFNRSTVKPEGLDCPV